MKNIGLIKEDKNGVWDLVRKFKKTHGPIKDDFELPPRSIEELVVESWAKESVS